MSKVALHWPEVAIDGFLLALFMVSAALFTALFEYPSSPVHGWVPNAAARRLLIGVAMGATAALLIYSPLGRRSGAHMNPAVTLTFARLGKVAPVEAAAYAGSQFVGGFLGLGAAALVLGPVLRASEVRFVVTQPGPLGVLGAFSAELAISFLLMLVVLLASSSPRWERWTGLFAAALVATYVALEAPLSGMSMNPARTLGSALWAQEFPALWVYFLAPPLGMLLAAELFVRRQGLSRAFCAKIFHGRGPCHFCGQLS